MYKSLVMVLVVISTLVAISAINGCSTVPSKSSVLQAPHLTVDADYINNTNNAWELKGKLSYQDGTKAAIVNIDWQYMADNSLTIRVFNALGGDLVKITKQNTKNGDATTIRIRGKDYVDPEDIATLVDEEVGYYVPLEQLEFWVKGQGWPGSEFAPYYSSSSEAGDLAIISLLQDGWQINYSKFEQGLARRITATRNPYVITLVISSWIKTSAETTKL